MVYSKNITYISKYIYMYNCLIISYINVLYYVLYKAMTCKKLLYHYIALSPIQQSDTTQIIFISYHIQVYRLYMPYPPHINFACHMI